MFQLLKFQPTTSCCVSRVLWRSWLSTTTQSTSGLIKYVHHELPMRHDRNSSLNSQVDIFSHIVCVYTRRVHHVIIYTIYHTCMHVYTHTHTHIQTYRHNTHPYRQTDTQIQTHTHSYRQTQTDRHTHTNTNAHPY